MVPTPKALLTAKLLRESGHGTAAVKGGPFKSAQLMECQILNAAGEAVGVVSNERVAKTLNQLAELHRVLLEVDAVSHLRQRFDNGHLEIPVEMFRSLEKLLVAQ